MNKILRTSMYGALLGAGATLAAGGYMVFEAQWLRLTRRQLALPDLPASLDGFKVLHVSDLHAGPSGPNARSIAKFVRCAERLEPDLVLFTGDMTDKKADLRPYLPSLARVQARYGKYAVLGNHDHGVRKTLLQDMARRFLGEARVPRTGFRDEDVPGTVALNRRLLEEADITLLNNECARIRTDSDDIQICGIDDFQYGYADLPGTTAQVDPGAALHILLSHSPDAVSAINNGDYQLVLAGHTHGGQICLPRPRGGKVLLSTSGSRYGDGIYRLDGLTLHISRGVGTTLLPFRLLSRPEITLLELTRAG